VFDLVVGLVGAVLRPPKRRSHSSPGIKEGLEALTTILNTVDHDAIGGGLDGKRGEVSQEGLLRERHRLAEADLAISSLRCRPEKLLALTAEVDVDLVFSIPNGVAGGELDHLVIDLIAGARDGV